MAARIPVPAGVPSALLGNRPDVRGAEASLRAATARIGVAQAAFLPTFTITGQYGTQSTEFSKWFGSGTNIWQAFAGVSIPLFTQGRPGAGAGVPGAVALRADGARGATRSGRRARGIAHRPGSQRRPGAPSDRAAPG